MSVPQFHPYQVARYIGLDTETFKSGEKVWIKERCKVAGEEGQGESWEYHCQGSAGPGQPNYTGWLPQNLLRRDY